MCSELRVISALRFLLYLATISVTECRVSVEGPIPLMLKNNIGRNNCITSRLYGGGNQTLTSDRERRGPVCITRVSSMGLLNPYFHDEDLGFSLFLERR